MEFRLFLVFVGVIVVWLDKKGRMEGGEGRKTGRKKVRVRKERKRKREEIYF